MRAATIAAFVISCGGSLLTSASSNADTVCGTGPTVKGVDVSYYQGDIDWPTAAGAGVEFAFVRVSDGTTFPDPTFAANWTGARAAGVLRGAYQFFRPAEDPIAQADLLLSTMGALQPGDLPPVLDVEVDGGLAAADVAAGVRAWVAHVQMAIGRAPIIYTGKYFWDDSVDATDLGDLPLWHAQYTSAACPDISGTWSNWAFWQYSSTGTVDGIPGAGGLDVDVWNGDRASLDAFANAPATPACGIIAATGGEIDDGDACFAQGGPSAYMRQVTTAGEEGDLLWTHATDAATEANFADWSFVLAASGRYRVEVYTAAPWAMSKQADYQLTIAGATTSVTIDQSASDGWQALGDFDFAAGGGQGVHLGDNTGEDPAANIQLVFDAVRMTPLDDGSASGSDRDNPNGPGALGGGCAAGGGAPAGLVMGVGLGWIVVRRRRRS